MKALLLVAMGLLINWSWAQEHAFGMGGGLTLSTIKSKSFDDYKHVAGSMTEGQYWFSSGHFLAKTSVGFQNKGFAQELLLVDTVGNVLGKSALERTRFSYMGLSQFVGVTLEYEKFMTYGGLGASFLRYFRTRIILPDGQLDDGSTYQGYDVILADASPLDISTMIEAGVGLRGELDTDFLLVARYQFGMFDISNEAADFTWKNRTISLFFVLRYRFPHRADLA